MNYLAPEPVIAFIGRSQGSMTTLGQIKYSVRFVLQRNAKDVSPEKRDFCSHKLRARCRSVLGFVRSATFKIKLAYLRAGGICIKTMQVLSWTSGFACVRAPLF
jgi:hypothetical protein